MSKVSGPSNATAPGLITPGNIINLYNRPETKPPAGPNGLDRNAGMSTTYSKSFGLGGHEVLLPTVVNGKFLTDQEAVARYHATGEHLGHFDTPEHADAYAQSLHESQQAIGDRYKYDRYGRELGQ